jgi:predicted AlkP superfamily phosphohydrolase/phosphomutase
MIGLDAADPVLLERWTSDGTLPHLAALRRGGVWGRLSTSARYLAGSPWPTFYTGQPPSHHGIYHDFQWRHERMSFASPGGGWLPVQPFWRALEGDLNVVVYDVPMIPGAEPLRGVEVTGWASHDRLAPPGSHPPELVEDIRRRWGEWHVPPEPYGRIPVASLLEVREVLLDNTRQSLELCLELLRHPWDLALAVFSALHRGGHRLWDRSSAHGDGSDEAWHAFDEALRDLYVACDEAVGRLVAAAPDALVIAFSVHGMTENTSRADLMDAMLARVLHPDDGRSPRRGLVRRLGERLPLAWRRRLTGAVPVRLRDRIMTVWSTGGTDWHRTPAFTLRADLQGYVRINLAGREPQGIVRPGSDYDRLCERIAEGLLSFRDASTGEPFIHEVCRTDEVYPIGSRRDRLPDLLVLWTETPAAPHAAVRSATLGVVERATPGRIPGGRSANHRPQGFLVARGPGLAGGRTLESDADIVDLAPTVLSILGGRTRQPLAGRVLPTLAGAAGLPE